METREQTYAIHAHSVVDAVSKTAQRIEYKRLVRRFPILVRKAGLVHALAYLQVKSEDVQYAMFANDLQKILRGTNVLDTNQVLHEVVTNCDGLTYLYTTREVMYAVYWIKRMADTMIVDES